MKHDFEQRKQNKILYAEQQAQKNKQKAADLYQQAKDMASGLPFGQPILVGHHSEQKDRNFRRKIHNTFGKSFKAQNKADYYEEKAATIENNKAIFSDDPQALLKLKAKLAGLQEMQAFMKAANKCIRKKDKDAFLLIPGASEQIWQKLLQPDYLNRVGYAAYQLQNNNANIKTVQKRIVALEQQEQQSSTETLIGDVRMMENVEANRLQLFFPDKPSEAIRTSLKKRGFRWSPSAGAWQRHLSDDAAYVAREILKQYADQSSDKTSHNE